jgi:prepilin-type N-terminal cleavage/methylation domain-containing protein
MAHCNRHRGFTLLETVITLVLIALVLAAAAPALRGWGRGAKLRDAATQFLAVTGYARSQAAATAMTHRLLIEPDGSGYQVAILAEGQLQLARGEFGGRVSLPLGYRIEIVSATGAGIDFHPSGRTSPAVVRIRAESGESIDLVCDTPAQPFRLASSER